MSAEKSEERRGEERRRGGEEERMWEGMLDSGIPASLIYYVGTLYVRSF